MLSLGALRRRHAGFDAARGGLLNRAPFLEWHRRLLPSSDQSNVTATRDQAQARVIKRSVIARRPRRWDARSTRGPPAPHVTGAVDTRNYVTGREFDAALPLHPFHIDGRVTVVRPMFSVSSRCLWDSSYFRGRRRPRIWSRGGRRAVRAEPGAVGARGVASVKAGSAVAVDEIGARHNA